MGADANNADLIEDVEVVDTANRPFLVMPLAEAHRQTLAHRSVIVLVYDHDLARVYLRKNGPMGTFPGRWDVTARDHVAAGQSSHDAALRCLGRVLDGRHERLRHVLHLEASLETGREFVSVHCCEKGRAPLRTDGRLASGFSAFNRDDLGYIIREFREVVTPVLIHLWDRGALFAPGEFL